MEPQMLERKGRPSQLEIGEGRCAPSAINQPNSIKTSSIQVEQKCPISHNIGNTLTMAHCNHRSRNSLLPHWLGLRAVSKQLRFVPLRTSNYRRTPCFDSRRLSSWQHYRRNGRDSLTTSCDHDDYMSIAATRFTFVCVLPRPLPFAPTCHPRWQDSRRDATPRRR